MLLDMQNVTIERNQALRQRLAQFFQTRPVAHPYFGDAATPELRRWYNTWVQSVCRAYNCGSQRVHADLDLQYPLVPEFRAPAYHSPIHCLEVALRTIRCAAVQQVWGGVGERVFDANDLQALFLAGLYHDQGYSVQRTEAQNIDEAVRLWEQDAAQDEAHTPLDILRPLVSQLIRATTYPYSTSAGWLTDQPMHLRPMIQVLRDADRLSCLEPWAHDTQIGLWHEQRQRRAPDLPSTYMDWVRRGNNWWDGERHTVHPAIRGEADNAWAGMRMTAHRIGQFGI